MVAAWVVALAVREMLAAQMQRQQEAQVAVTLMQPKVQAAGIEGMVALELVTEMVTEMEVVAL